MLYELMLAHRDETQVKGLMRFFKTGKGQYGVTLTKLEDVKNADCVIVAVAHNEFRKLSLNEIKTLFKECNDSEKVLIDVKGLYKVKELEASGMKWWRL